MIANLRERRYAVTTNKHNRVSREERAIMPAVGPLGIANLVGDVGAAHGTDEELGLKMCTKGSGPPDTRHTASITGVVTFSAPLLE